MIFRVDPEQLKAAIGAADRLTAELRRLNDVLEAGRPAREAAEAARDSAARPAAGPPR